MQPPEPVPFDGIPTVAADPHTSKIAPDDPRLHLGPVDASVIEAMPNVGKFVSDPVAKKIPSEADGIGTPATRGSIIETLFKRGLPRDSLSEKKRRSLTHRR
jgi:DNA topoisomerase III